MHFEISFSIKSAKFHHEICQISWNPLDSMKSTGFHAEIRKDPKWAKDQWSYFFLYLSCVSLLLSFYILFITPIRLNFFYTRTFNVFWYGTPPILVWVLPSISKMLEKQMDLHFWNVYISINFNDTHSHTGIILKPNTCRLYRNTFYITSNKLMWSLTAKHTEPFRKPFRFRRTYSIKSQKSENLSLTSNCHQFISRSWRM